VLGKGEEKKQRELEGKRKKTGRRLGNYISVDDVEERGIFLPENVKKGEACLVTLKDEQPITAGNSSWPEAAK